MITTHQTLLTTLFMILGFSFNGFAEEIGFKTEMTTGTFKLIQKDESCRDGELFVANKTSDPTLVLGSRSLVSFLNKTSFKTVDLDCKTEGQNQISKHKIVAVEITICTDQPKLRRVTTVTMADAILTYKIETFIDGKDSKSIACKLQRK